jgi:hypothetical protein
VFNAAVFKGFVAETLSTAREQLMCCHVVHDTEPVEKEILTRSSLLHRQCSSSQVDVTDLLWVLGAFIGMGVAFFFWMQREKARIFIQKAIQDSGRRTRASSAL